MQLDSRTLVVVAVVVALVPGIIGALVWITRRTHPGRWALGNLLAAFAMLLLCLRGHAPDAISIVLANSLLLGVGIVFLQGIRQFRGLRIVWWPECLVAAVAIAFIIYFRYATDNINARILSVSLATGVLGIACGMTLLKKMPRGRRVGLMLTGLIFTIWGAGLIFRGFYVFTFAPVQHLFDPSWFNALFFAGVSLGMVSWSLGFFVLTENATQLRQLAADLQDAREEERARIARELHDELGQVLTALKLDIEDLSHRVALGEGALKSQFQATVSRVECTIRNVRKIATELRPAVLDLGLVEAIEWLLQDLQDRAGTKYSLALPAEEIALDADRSTAVFRIFQEALTNATRHSSATRIDVSVTLHNGVLILEVRDNGKGISEARLKDRTTSLGILGMRERARSLGGEAIVAAQAEGGTLVRARIPLQFHATASGGQSGR